MQVYENHRSEYIKDRLIDRVEQLISKIEYPWHSRPIHSADLVACNKGLQH